MAPQASKRRWWHAAPYALFGALIFLAYGSAIHNDYVWDDLYFFGDYVWVYDLKGALEVAFEPLFSQRSYVRPLPLLMLFAEAIASDRNPALSHAVNLLIHGLCTSLVFIIARRATNDAAVERKQAQRTWLPLLLAAIFAVHPALSETPIWVSSRFDLMATLFFLVALLVATLKIQDIHRALLLGIIYFIGALSKESIVVLPFFIAAYAMFLGASQRNDGSVRITDALSRREIKTYVALLISGATYLLLRHWVLKDADLVAFDPISPTEQLSRVTVALSGYTQLTFLPFIGSSPHHPWSWAENSTLATYWPAHLASGALVAIVATLVIRRTIAGWWLLAWLIAYIPVLHLIPLPIGQNLIHQRFMYLPTAALLVLSPYALLPIRLTSLARKTAIGLTLLAVLVSIPIDRSLTRVWRSDIALWSWAVQASPESAEARESLIFAYLGQGMFQEAEEQFAEIVEKGMNTSVSLPVNIGTAKYRQEKFEDALYYYSIAEKHQNSLPAPLRSRLLSNIGVTHAILGHPEEAKHYALLALKTNPRNRTSIGHLLGYCKDVEIDISHLDPRDISNANQIAEDTASLMEERQPTLHARREFCPHSALQSTRNTTNELH